MTIDSIEKLLRMLEEDVLKITIKCDYNVKTRHLDLIDLPEGWEIDWVNTTMGTDDCLIVSFEKVA